MYLSGYVTLSYLHIHTHTPPRMHNKAANISSEVTKPQRPTFTTDAQKPSVPCN